MKKEKPQLDIDSFRIEKPKKVIPFEENELFKAAFDSDHPDYVDPDFINPEVDLEESKTETVIEPTPTKEYYMYDGLSKDEWWEKQKRVYPKSIQSKKILPKRRPNFIHNQILGYVLPEVEREAVERGAIIKKTFQNLTYYCIPSESIVVDRGKGKSVEGIMISQVYTDFMEELKNNKVKINKSTLI